MKIFRKIAQKIFSRDIIPGKLIAPFLISKFIQENNLEKLPIEVDIDDSLPSFQNKLKNLGTTERKQVRLFREDIKKLKIFKDGSAGGDTHILTGYSNNNFLRVSKSINNFDRLIYQVHKPEIIEKNINGKVSKIVSQRIVLESCDKHWIYGQGNYLKDKTLINKANKKRVIDPRTVKSNKKRR